MSPNRLPMGWKPVVQPRLCTRSVAPLKGRIGHFGHGSARVYGVIADVYIRSTLDGDQYWYRVLTDKLRNIWFVWLDYEHDGL